MHPYLSALEVGLEKIIHYTIYLMEVKLRNWQVSDIPALVKLGDNLNIARNMTDGFPRPYTCESAERFIALASHDQPRKIQAILFDNKVCGSIGIYPQFDIFKLNAELAYWLGEPYWGKGIMSQAVRLMCDYAFSSWKLQRIYARPFGRNTASQRVLEKAGFTLEYSLQDNLFKDGKLEDELCYGLRNPNFKL